MPRSSGRKTPSVSSKKKVAPSRTKSKPSRLKGKPAPRRAAPAKARKGGKSVKAPGKKAQTKAGAAGKSRLKAKRSIKPKVSPKPKPKTGQKPKAKPSVKVKAAQAKAKAKVPPKPKLKAIPKPKAAPAKKAPATPEPVVKPKPILKLTPIPKPKPVPVKKVRRVNFDAKTLATIKANLETERAELVAQLEQIEQTGLAGPQAEGHGEGGFDEDYADAGSATFEKELDLSLANNVTDLLGKIDKALEKIAEGTYGLCENCGEPISADRLKALPYVLLCIKCKKAEERR